VAKPTPSASKLGAHAEFLIGRLTSAVATWDFEPEEVNGFELVSLRHSVRQIQNKTPGGLIPAHLEVTPYRVHS
jgi:hypothetical protein